MATFLTMGELVGLAIGTPEPGAVNFTVLQALLRSIIDKLALGDVQTELDRRAIDDMQRRASETPIYKTLEPMRGDTLIRSKVESIDEDAFDFNHPPRRGSLLGSDDAQSMANRIRRASTGMIRADERARPFLFKKPLPPIMSLRELEMKVSRLEENWSKLNQLRLLKQHQHTEEQPQQKEGAQDDVDSFRPPMSVYEMWQSVQFEKKLDANTDGVNKLMSLTQDIIRKLQKLSESDAEQRQLIEDSHDKLRSLALNSNFETIQKQLNFLSEMVQQLPPVGSINNFITWAGLESSLRGDVPIQVLNETEHSVKRDSKTGPHQSTKEITGHHHEAKEETPFEGKRPIESKTYPQLEAKKKKSPETGKTDTQLETKEKKLIHSVTEPQLQRKDEKSLATSLESIAAESASRSSLPLTGSGFLESSYAGSDIIKVDNIDNGQPLLTLSPDFLNRLQALGKVNERFDRLESKMKQLEHGIKERPVKEEAPSSDALKDMADQIEAVNRELRNYKDTRNELNALQEELSSSKMPSLTFSQSILAASKTQSLGTIEDGTPDVSSETDEGAQQVKRRSSAGQAQVKRRRSLAFDAIEKSMKIIDNTVAVLQRSVKELDDKLKKQLENVNRRIDTMRIVAMEAEATPKDVEDEHEEMDRSKEELGTRVAYLEKTMADKQREMRKIQSQMTDLSAEVSSQMEVMMNNINAFVQKMEQDVSQKTIAAPAQDDTMNVMYGVQSTYNDMRSEVEKLKHFTLELYDSSNRQQHEIDVLHRFTDDLKGRADKTEREIHANRSSLEQKLDSRKFEETCDELRDTINNLLNRIVLLDSEWRTSVEKLGTDLSNCLGKDEFDSLSEKMITDIRALAKKLSRLQKQVDEMRFLSDDAAAVKRQLFTCLSCDRPVVMTAKSPKPSIPYREGLLSRRSTKPFTTYGLEQLRQNGRGFIRPQNMSNYERALFERRLTRSSIRDLRSDCTNYWRSIHSCNPAGASSDDRDHHHTTTTHSPGENRITNTPTVDFQDLHSNQEVPGTEDTYSPRPVPAVSDSTVCNQGSVPSGESSLPVATVVKRRGTGFAKDLSLPIKVRPPQTSSVPFAEEDEFTRRRSSASSGGDKNSHRGSLPRSSVKHRKMPANMGLGISAKEKTSEGPPALSTAEENEISKRRSSASTGESSLPVATVVKRRGTGFAKDLSLPIKVRPPQTSSVPIAEEDEFTRRRSSASSGGDKNSHRGSLPRSSVKHHKMPANMGLGISAKEKTSEGPSALSTAEENEISKRRSSASTAKEDPDVSRISNPNGPDSSRHAADEEADISAVRSSKSNEKAIPEDEEPPKDLPENKQEEY